MTYFPWEPPEGEYGIIIGLYPSSDPRFGIEIQESQYSAGGAPFGAKTIDRLPPGDRRAFQYRHITPNDAITRQYRARHILPGWTDGDWSTWTRQASPIYLGGGFPATPMSGQGVSVDLWLSTKASIKVGNQRSSASFTKTHRVAGQSFMPSSEPNSYAWTKGVSWLGSVSTVSMAMVSNLPFVRGTIVTKVRARVLRNSTSDSIGVIFRRGNSTAVMETLATLTVSTSEVGSWVTIASSDMSESISTASVYFFRTEMTASGGSANDAGLLWVEYDYTMDDFRRSL